MFSLVLTMIVAINDTPAPVVSNRLRIRETNTFLNSIYTIFIVSSGIHVLDFGHLLKVYIFANAYDPSDGKCLPWPMNACNN